MLTLHKKRIAPTCIAFSVVAHLVLLLPFWKYGRYNFGNAVGPLQAVMVDLAQASPQMAPVPKTNLPEVTTSASAPVTAPKAALAREPESLPLPTQSQPSPTGESAPPVEPSSPLVSDAQPDNAGQTIKAATVAPPTVAKKAATPLVHPPLRQAAEFLAAARERLTYQISMFNVPVGSAELEAKREQGEVRISLKVKSSAAFSGIYPVDDLVETRHIGGNYILTRIRQREGSFRSDRGFTLMLRDKKVFWIDRLTSRSLNETVPTSDVTDIISGLYYLRNRPLEVSKTENLHVYDSDTYADLPVEVLRRERIDLPGLRKADTIVIRPVLKTDGIFKRTGDVTIWLTDDAQRVPVKVETHIALGKVTIALVAADTETNAPTSETISAKADTQ